MNPEASREGVPDGDASETVAVPTARRASVAALAVSRNRAAAARLEDGIMAVFRYVEDLGLGRNKCCSLLSRNEVLWCAFIYNVVHFVILVYYLIVSSSLLQRCAEARIASPD